MKTAAGVLGSTRGGSSAIDSARLFLPLLALRSMVRIVINRKIRISPGHRKDKRASKKPRQCGATQGSKAFQLSHRDRLVFSQPKIARVPPFSSLLSLPLSLRIPKDSPDKPEEEGRERDRAQGDGDLREDGGGHFRQGKRGRRIDGFWFFFSDPPVLCVEKKREKCLSSTLMRDYRIFSLALSSTSTIKKTVCFIFLFALTLITATKKGVETLKHDPRKKKRDNKTD